MAVDQLVNCPRGVQKRARRHSVSVCQVVLIIMMVIVVVIMLMIVIIMMMKVIILMMIMIVVMIIIMRWSLHIHPLGLIHKLDNYHDKTLATSIKFKNCHMNRCWVVFKIIKVNLLIAKFCL